MFKFRSNPSVLDLLFLTASDYLMAGRCLLIDISPQLWTDQDDLFNLPYFTTDHNEQIQKKLREMKDRWLNIKPQ